MNNLQLSVLLSAVDKLSAPMRKASKATTELAQKLKQNKSALYNLARQQKENDKAIEKYRNALNPLKQKLSETNTTLAQAQKQAKHFEQQLANAKNPTEQFKAKVASAKENVTQLKREQTELTNKLKNTREEFRKSGISAERMAQKQQELRQKTKGATTEVEKQRAELKRLNQAEQNYQNYRHKVEKLKDWSGKAQMMGTQSMIAGSTISAPVISAVKDFSSFEDVMAGVARQVQGIKDENGNFTKEYDVWAQKIRNLSKELPLTTNQIGEMVTAAARMEVANDEIENFIRLNTQMATAFDAENPDELVEQFGKVAKNFKLSSQAGKELADVINYLDDNAISKGTEIIGFMNRVSGISGIAKISEKNMAALGSTLQTAGAGEEQSATAVNAIFTRLSSANKKKPVRNALKAMGISADSVEMGMVKDAQGTIMKLVDTLKKMPEQKRLGLIADLVGTEHSKTLALLVSNTEEWRRQITLANSEEAKGSMGREFQTRMTTLSSQWQLFTNRLFNTNSILGGSLKETIIGIVDSLNGVLDKVEAWTNANPELTATMMKLTVGIGGTLTVLGGLLLTMSFFAYPLLRVLLYFKELNITMPKFSTGAGRMITTLKSFRATGTALISMLRSTGLFMLKLLNPLTYLRGGLNLVLGIFRGLFVVGSALFTPLGAIIALLVGGALLIYRHWEQVKAFFGGFWDGLKSGLAPVIEKFKPLGDMFGVVVGWIKSAVKWVTDLISPVETTTDDLDEAAAAGKSFGEKVAKAIDLITAPLKVVMDGMQWIIDNANKVNPFTEENKKTLNKLTDQESYNDRLMEMQATGGYVRGYGASHFATGGYTGNGGRFDPAGIVHRGEFVFNKAATSRLGTGFLTTLHNAKTARAGMLAAGLTAGMATAQPLKIDNRPPLASRPQVIATAPTAPINITIHAAQGQDANTIAQLVAQQVQRALAKERQQQRTKYHSQLIDH